MSPELNGLLNPNAIVVRRMNVSAIDKVKNDEVQYIIPTIGYIFHVTSEDWASLKQISIYSSLGNQIAEFKDGSKNAQRFPEGFYIAIIE